jgi:HK97 gp10 family phage protein
MANRIRLRITGLQELQRAVQAYGDRLVQASVQAVTDAVTETVTEARAAAPVGQYPPTSKKKAGTLRDSIVGEVTADAYGASGRVRATAPHAHLLEFGTQRMDAQPFFVAPAIAARRRLTTSLARTVQTAAPEGLGRPRVTGDTGGVPSVEIA